MSFPPLLHSIGPYELTEKNEFDEYVQTILAEYIQDMHAKEPFKLHFSVPNPPSDTVFQFGFTYRCNQQQMRKQIVQRYSSFVVSAVVFLGILFNIWTSQLSFIQGQPLHKEHNVSIWPPLLGLFGFMVFVCAVALMILSGAQFTSMQKTMLIFLIILMHLQLAKSISEVFVLLVGGVFMGWVAFGKSKQLPNEVI